MATSVVDSSPTAILTMSREKELQVRSTPGCLPCSTCKIGSEPAGDRPIDAVDLAYAGIIAVILLLKLIGTTYDALPNSDNKPNRCLKAWSVIANWKRLTANYDDRDPRLATLNSSHGSKTLTLIMVMCAHTLISHYMAYLENPDFLEKTSYHPLVAFLHNGTVIVQTFVVLSSFLLAYNLLLHADDRPHSPLSLRMLPQCLLHRVARYLAVDMQLYLLAAVLTLTLGQKTLTALKVVGGLFLASIVANFVVAYNWNLKPMLFIMEPQLLRTEFLGEPSFTWLYMSPWGSVPASLAGLLLALIYHHLQRIGFKPAEHLWIRVVYRLSVPCMLACIVRARTIVALYVALDRPVFALLIATAIFGFFCKIDRVWWRLMSWGAWRAPSRMSLSVLMVHWSFTLMQVAITAPTHSSIGTISLHWAITAGLSYITVVPLFLLVESPVQRFFQAISNTLTSDKCHIKNIQNLFTSLVLNKLLYSRREINRNLGHDIPAIADAQSADIPQRTINGV